MGVTLYGNEFQGNVLINNHIVEENLQLFLDPNNDESYNYIPGQPETYLTVRNIAPPATNNGISGSLTNSDQHADYGTRNSYINVETSDASNQVTMSFSENVVRNVDEESTLQFYFWSDYDATGQYGGSAQSFFGGKYTNYMSLLGGGGSTYGAEAETNGVGAPDNNHDYFARSSDNANFTKGAWNSWTSVFSGSKNWNYYNHNISVTRSFLSNDTAVHSFSKLGSTSAGSTSADRGGEIRMGALLLYDRALTTEEVEQNLDVLNRRFQD